MFGSKKSKDPVSSTPVKAAAASGAGQSIGAMTNGAASAGSGAKAATPDGKLSAQEAQQRSAMEIRQSVAFAQIVSVLMRSPHYKHYTLSDLEWLVLPPLMLGQFSVAEASAHQNGPRFPAAVVLWASVSAEVDKALSANLTAPMRLRPDEWKSGEILWLVDAVGDARVVPELLKRLRQSVFKQKELKIRTKGQDGKPVVQILRAESAG